MLDGEQCTEKKCCSFSKRLDEAEVDICYLDDPTKSFFDLEEKINQDPLRYGRYTDEIPKSITANELSADQTLLSECKRKTWLKERSVLDHIFVSVCSRASDPFNERGKKKDSDW